MPELDAHAAQLIDSLGTFACMLPIIANRPRFAPMKHPEAYIAIAAMLELVYAFARPSLPFWTRIADLGVNLIFPFAMYTTSYGHRAIVILISLLPPLICESFCFALQSILPYLKGTLSTKITSVTTSLFLIRLVYIATELLLYEAIALFIKKHLKGTRHDLAGRSALLPATQFPIILTLLYVTMFSDHKTIADGLAVAGFIVICFLTDFFIMLSAERASRAISARERSRALELQIDEILAEYEDLANQAATISRLRHDVRNHIQTANALVHRGCIQQAREYLIAMRKEAER